MAETKPPITGGPSGISNPIVPEPAATSDVPYKIYRASADSRYDLVPDLQATGSGYAASQLQEGSVQDFMTDYGKNKDYYDSYFSRNTTPGVKEAFQQIISGGANNAPINSGYVMNNGVLTTQSAIDQSKSLASDPNMINIGTAEAPKYVPKGSAGDKLSSGIASGAVSATDPTAQFAASMQGNNVTDPGINPVAPQINTSQPNGSINATPFTGLQMPTGAAAGSVYNPQTGQQELKAGFAAAQASGTAAPQAPGEAKSAMTGFTPTTPTVPTPQGMSPIEQQLALDPGYQQLLADRAEYNNVVNQGKSLTDTYNQMIKDLGIPGINAELLNTQKIIDGTEDDIRNEVRAVDGFATESQVLALAASRNKQLIKNYNNLLSTKQMAMEQVNNMVNLASQDRQFAMQSVMQKMEIDQQIAQYRDKFMANAKEGYQNIINAVGYQGLHEMLQGDPGSLALAERTLGLGQGQLGDLSAFIGKQNKLKQLADYNITSPYVIDKDGRTVVDARTGYSYTSADDFKARTGLDINQARQQGMVQPLGMTRDQEEKQFDRDLKLAEFGLKQDQFAWDQYKDTMPGETNTSWQEINGQRVLVNDDTGEIINNPTASQMADPASQARVKSNIDLITGLLSDKGLNSAVGPNFIGRTSIWNKITGTKSNFVAGIEQLRSQLTLDSLISAKARGATFGALSEGEMRVLDAAASKLGTWAIKDKTGQIVGYNTNESSFRKEIEKINNFAKLDYIARGGDPAEVGIQQTNDGRWVAPSSDGGGYDLTKEVNQYRQQSYGPTFNSAGNASASNQVKGMSQRAQTLPLLNVNVGGKAQKLSLTQAYPQGSRGGQCGTWVRNVVEKTGKTYPRVGDTLSQKMATARRYGVPLSKAKQGSVVLTNENKATGHVAYIVGRNSKGFILAESNYGLNGKVSYGRVLPFNSKSILGIINPS